MNIFLTVFTPSYNRAYTLEKCYKSLVKQTCKEFEWLIIDDGSTDETKKLVEQWIIEKKIKIRYIYQKNQGMHGAHNTAYENIKTELNVCIDSDDYMPKNAVEIIKNEWAKIEDKTKIAGLIALDAKEDGQVIGTKFQVESSQTTLFDFYYKEKGQGDKKLVYKSELTKKYPYPVFDNEKYVGLNYKYHKLDLDYKLITVNKVICIVEYLEDGSTKNMLKQYRKNPKGFSYYRLEAIKNPKADFSYRFRNLIHYISSSIMCKDWRFFKKVDRKLETILAVPFGALLYLYIILKTKKES